MSTIVTAFITNINSIDFRDIETYMDYGKKLLSQSIPTVCFLEKKVFDHFFKNNELDYVNTKFIIFEKDENYLYEYEKELTNYNLHTDNPKKDTPGYMFIQCHKTEWIRRAIDINPFNTSNFMWIDFGIYHMIKDDLDFAISIRDATSKKYTGLRIGSCVNPETNRFEKDIYKDVAWFFAGSVFGGDINTLIKFADNMKTKCIDIIKTKKHLMWEVNIWWLLFKQDSSYFRPYGTDHNILILQNY